MRSVSTKKPLPRESFSPRASNVAIATAEGLMRRTNSGRRSCDASIGSGLSRSSKNQTNFMRSFVFVPLCGSILFQHKALHARYDVTDSNILALFCAAVKQLNHAVGNFFPNRDAIRYADQVRVFELHTRAFVAIVEQNLDTYSL